MKEEPHPQRVYICTVLQPRAVLQAFAQLISRTKTPAKETVTQASVDMILAISSTTGLTIVLLFMAYTRLCSLFG
jgi:hypothetical protein